MKKKAERLTVIIETGKKRMVARTPLTGLRRLVFVVNRQFTNAPNTTQISSGAGRSSAGGNNAAINSPYTKQQQSVGAGGTAKNKVVKGINGWRNGGALPSGIGVSRKEVVIVVNDQVVKLPKGSKNASATQVTSGGGVYSTGGTNSAIESAGTKQQHAVGGGGVALNKWINNKKNRKK
jgi:hypothetical protein